MNKQTSKSGLLYALIALVVLLIWAIGAAVYYQKLLGPAAYPATICIGFVLLVITLLCIVTCLYDMLNLSDKSQALGLPDGSVRAVIAFVLLVMFVAVPILVVLQANISTTNTWQTDLIKQHLTTVATLVTAVVSFYFGAGTAKSAQAPTSAGMPSIKSVDPSSGTLDKDLVLNITGSNLEMVKGASIVSGTVKRDLVGVTSNATLATGTLRADASLTPGKWDLVFETSDGKTARLPDAFTVHPSS